MTEWFTTPETTPRATCPNEIFVRFVATNFKPPASFLEIGSGSGANLRWLEEHEFTAIGVDPAPRAYANFHQDICEFLSDNKILYDCIFDINTLCHVEDPPYRLIYEALNPGGKFFSIHPANDTEVNMAGKGYTRLADALTMRGLLGRGFMRFTVHKDTIWNGDIKTTSWQITADK